MSFRSRASVSPRQPSTDLIFASISLDGDASFVPVGFFFVVFISAAFGWVALRSQFVTISYLTAVFPHDCLAHCERKSGHVENSDCGPARLIALDCGLSHLPRHVRAAH